MSLHELNYTALFCLTHSVVFSLKGHCHGDGERKKKPQLMLASVVPKARSIDSPHGMENGDNWDELVFSFFIPSCLFLNSRLWHFSYTS